MPDQKNMPPLRRVGWGRIPLPWTRKRREETERRGRELLAELTGPVDTELRTRNRVDFTVFRDEDGFDVYLEAHDHVFPETDSAYPLDRDEARRLGRMLLEAAR